MFFKLGKRYGFNGRIFSYTIIIDSNVLVEKKRIKGWAFVPQEGNSILSTLHATLLQMELLNAEQIMAKIKADLLRYEW